MLKKLLGLWARYERWVTLAALAIAVIFPIIFTKRYMLNIGILSLMYALLAISLNIMTGYTGIVVLGQAAFFGVGAYTYAILTTNFPITFIPGALASMVVALGFGLLIGLPTLRVKGNYLSIVTLGFCEIVRIVELNWTDLTGGPFGIKNIPAPHIAGVAFKSPTMKYYLMLAILAIVIILVNNLMDSRTGRAFAAIKGDEVAAQAMGVDVFGSKLKAFGTAASLAGLAGAFYASYVNYIDSTTFNFNQSILILSMIIMGGLASIPGSIIGAVFYMALPEVLRAMGESFTDWRQVIYGVILVIMIMFKPSGLLGGFNLNQMRLFSSLGADELAAAEAVKGGGE